MRRCCRKFSAALKFSAERGVRFKGHHSMQISDTLIGIFLGGAFTAASFVYKRRVDNISKLKRSLYQLLILYRSVAVKSFDTNQILNPLTEALIEILPDFKKGENHDDQGKVVISRLIDKSLIEESENLFSLYLGVVDDVSEIDPILAYRLNSNVGLKKYLAAVDELTIEAKSAVEAISSDAEKKFVEVFFSGISDFVTANILTELKRDIIRLSIRCGLLTFISAWKMIRISKNITENDTSKYKTAIK